MVDIEGVGLGVAYIVAYVKAGQQKSLLLVEAKTQNVISRQVNLSEESL